MLSLSYIRIFRICLKNNIFFINICLVRRVSIDRSLFLLFGHLGVCGIRNRNDLGNLGVCGFRNMNGLGNLGVCGIRNRNDLGNLGVCGFRNMNGLGNLGVCGFRNIIKVLFHILIGLVLGNMSVCGQNSNLRPVRRVFIGRYLFLLFGLHGNLLVFGSPIFLLHTQDCQESLLGLDLGGCDSGILSNKLYCWSVTHLLETTIRFDINYNFLRLNYSSTHIFVIIKFLLHFLEISFFLFVTSLLHFNIFSSYPFSISS